MISTKNRKKILTSAIAAVIFLALVGAVVFTLMFIREGLGKTVGELKGVGNGEVHFDFQKANELGITTGQ